MNPAEQTIVAVATARNPAAISIIRLSGPDAFAILEKLFVPATSLPPAPRTLALGKIINPANGTPLDSALTARFPAPASYTGENMAEIYLHGGVFLTNRVLECTLSAGARAADPGEFTLRAFAAGKLDLTQAEAIGDIIGARNEHFLTAALSALEGRLSFEIRRIRSGLINLLSAIEVVIEYPDEDIHDMPGEQISAALSTAAADIGHLLQTYTPAQTLNRGPSIAIAGRPNVGKSSLMNRLLGQNRSITHPSPGTTRDLVGDTLAISGIDALIMDTAGITNASDPVEQEGIERTKHFIETADLVLLLLDASRPLDTMDLEIAEMIRKHERQFVVLLNKSDLENAIDKDTVRCEIGDPTEISAATGSGIDAVRATIIRAAEKSLSGMDNALVTNVRHKQLLESAAEAIADASKALTLPQDILSIDIRNAANLLGQITGENTAADILENIFRNFCVGK